MLETSSLSKVLTSRSALQPTTGKLFTYLRNKWTYIFFLGLFELGSLICGLANSSNMLIAGRTVAGLGASGLFNGALTILSASVPLQKRPAIMGALMGCKWIIPGLRFLAAFANYNRKSWPAGSDRWASDRGCLYGILNMAMV